MDQEIRFCTASDGVGIAYGWSGNGPPLVLVASYLRHLEFDWLSPVWRHWHLELSQNHTCVRYDERGTGLSDWNADDLSFEAWVSDLEAVVEAVNLDRFPMIAMSQAGPVAIAFAARNPEKVSKLILIGTYARGWLNRDLTQEQIEEEELLISLMQVGWGRENPAFRQFFSSQMIPEATPEQLRWYNDLMRISASPENAIRLEREMHRVDVRGQAAKVKAETLIFHARYDQAVPFEEGRLVAKLIPNARFVPLESKNHVLLPEEPAWFHFVREFRRFMGVTEFTDFSSGTTVIEDRSGVGVDKDHRTTFAAVLFTDIVESTAQQRLHGDRGWLELLGQINGEMSRLSAVNGGQVVKYTGDGMMAVFATAGSALVASRQMVSAARAMNLELRAGVHAGDVIIHNEDYSGTVVTIASRVSDLADGGEILTTDVVKGLVEGSDFTFAEHGHFELKGLGRRTILRLSESSMDQS
jgi:pimeloyl-ACP methyl ester carboxylesterase/class 3 adenylate cyclase